MSSNSGSIIVISNNNKFPVYLDGAMISNIYFKDLDEFIQTYNNFPLTASKIIVFESGIINLDSIRKFSDIVLNDVSQVGELLFLVGVDFKQYFLVSLDNFTNKRFLPEDITYKALESIVTETQSYALKNEVELVDVIQRKRKSKKVDAKIDRFQTRVTIDRRVNNPKIDREGELLDREVLIEEHLPPKSRNQDSQFNYIHYPRETTQKSSNILVYDNGLNLYNIVKSQLVAGKKVMFIDYTDSLFFSFLIETDKEIKDSLNLEDIYSEGSDTDEIRNIMDEKEVVIIRNSYALKRTLLPEQMESLIKFIVGRYGKKFENVYIITDDIKVSWAGITRYVILPPSMDSLMKFVNYIDRESIATTYLRLGAESQIKGFGIDENVVRSYLANLEIDKVRVIDGNPNDSVDSYLLDLTQLEIDENAEKAVKR